MSYLGLFFGWNARSYGFLNKMVLLFILIMLTLLWFHFQAAVAAQSSIVYELKETPTVPKVEEHKPLARKNPPARPLGGLIIKVQPQAKKAKADEMSSEKSSDNVKTTNDDTGKSTEIFKGALGLGIGGLVSYSDESEDDDS
uniref:Uncharacterized protein n=1 Tax=Nelumbo nucifera TaxID=4432 RepID=A0A822YQ50_NELNU|nr:TPA_asm: hypothetical protein HUJ06_011797 [Nelumbo nucifera]